MPRNSLRSRDWRRFMAASKLGLAGLFSIAIFCAIVVVFTSPDPAEQVMYGLLCIALSVLAIIFALW